MKKDETTLKELFLFMYEKLNGYNLNVIGDLCIFDLEFNDYCFSFDLTKNTIKLNPFVEIMKNDSCGDFQKCKKVFNTKIGD